MIAIGFGRLVDRSVLRGIRRASASRARAAPPAGPREIPNVFPFCSRLVLGPTGSGKSSPLPSCSIGSGSDVVAFGPKTHPGNGATSEPSPLRALRRVSLHSKERSQQLEKRSARALPSSTAAIRAASDEFTCRRMSRFLLQVMAAR
jgi:hypothetical protein